MILTANRMSMDMSWIPLPTRRYWKDRKEKFSDQSTRSDRHYGIEMVAINIKDAYTDEICL